jgi:hypothetical protein
LPTAPLHDEKNLPEKNFTVVKVATDAKMGKSENTHFLWSFRKINF